MRITARGPRVVPIPAQRVYVVTLADGAEAELSVPASWDEARLAAFLADVLPVAARVLSVRPAPPASSP